MAAWGGGGGGANRAANALPGAGGGGGAYYSDTIQVTTGDTFSITIGNGGAPFANGAATLFTRTSSPGISIVVAGGMGAIFTQPGTGGPASPIGNAETISGSNGTTSYVTYLGSPGGGMGGSSPKGGGTSTGGDPVDGSSGQTGITPGAGGGGAGGGVDQAFATTGGPGAPGRVVIYFPALVP